MSRTSRGREAVAVTGLVAMLLSVLSILLISTAPVAEAVAVDYATVDGHEAPVQGRDGNNNDPEYWEKKYDLSCVKDDAIGSAGVKELVAATDHDLIVVKAGSGDYANTLFFDVAAGETVWADTNGDFAPGDKLAISHVIFCDGDSPEQPEPKIESVYGEWVGDWECGDTQVTETRTVTQVTTPYVFDEQTQTWVLDPTNAVATPLPDEERTRDLTEGEQFDCPVLPQYSAEDECVDGTSWVRVTKISNPDGMPVGIYVDDVLVETTIDGTVVQGEPGQLLEVRTIPQTLKTAARTQQAAAETEEPVVLASANFTPCVEAPEPDVDATDWVDGEYECDDTQVEQTREVTTTTYKVEGDQVVVDTVDTVVETRMRDLEDDEITDCPNEEPEPDPTVAGFTAKTQCVALAPVVDWTVDVTEGDEPFGTRTLTVSTPSGTVLASVEVTGDAAGQIPLKGRDGESVNVAWDFDDQVESVTLAEPCATVFGVVLDKDPAPAPQPEPEPAPVVSDTTNEIPVAGATSDVLLVWAGGLLALGCGLLLTERRLARARR